MKIFEIQSFLKEKYYLSPVSIMEFEYEPIGNTDQEKRLHSVQFTKQMKQCTPAFDEIYNEQVKLLQSFSDFKYCYDTGFNAMVFYRLASLYSVYDRNLKSFLKVVKKHQSIPAVKSFYAEAVSTLSHNGYDVMMNDLTKFQPIVATRHLDLKRQYPEFQFDGAEPDMEEIKRLFKAK